MVNGMGILALMPKITVQILGKKIHVDVVQELVRIHPLLTMSNVKPQIVRELVPILMMHNVLLQVEKLNFETHII